MMASDDDEPALQAFNGESIGDSCSPCGVLPVTGIAKKNIALVQHGNGKMSHTMHQSAVSIRKVSAKIANVLNRGHAFLIF